MERFTISIDDRLARDFANALIAERSVCHGALEQLPANLRSGAHSHDRAVHHCGGHPHPHSEPRI